jgi:hypothetical protein
MNQVLITTLAIAATLAFATPAVHAEYISPSFEAKLQAAADGGPAAVNQLLYRTRAVYHLSMEEALRHVELHGNDEAASAADPTDGVQGGFAPAESPASSQGDGFEPEFFRNEARD